MKKNKIFTPQFSRVLFGVAAFCLLYIVLAMRPLSSELHLTPEWTENITHVQNVSKDEELIPFKLGQNIGYFTGDGKIASLVAYPFKASISSSYYATYAANNSSAEFYSSSGTKAGVLNEYGFPFFDEDRIFVFLPGGSSFVQCDKYGKRQWIYESYCPVTAFSSSKSGTVAGFADGTLVSFSQDGSVDQKFQPGGSNFQIILGAGISDDGSLIACVCGQKEQRFVVARKNGEHSKIIFHEYLEKGSTRQTLVKFNKAGDCVYYGFNGGLGVVDLQNLKSFTLPLEGNIVQIEEDVSKDLTYVLSRLENHYTVTVVERFNQSVASFGFNASSSFIQVREGSLFVGRDKKISKLTVARK